MVATPVQSGKKRQYRLYSPPPELLRWFDLHFPPSTFQGRLMLGMRAEGGMQTLFTGEKAAVRQVLEGFYGSRKKDYYITGNEISGVNRTRENCFALTNLTIDLDCHSEDIDYRTDCISRLSEQLCWRLRRDAEEIPLPHSVVMTGRGCQLWWHIRPCAVACLPYYSEVLDYYLQRLKELLQDNKELSVLSVDGSSSRNLVGYYRLPTTYNTVAQTWSTVSFPDTENREYTLQELWQKVKDRKQKRIQERQLPAAAPAKTDFLSSYTQEELVFLKDIRVTAFFRLRQMTELRILRNRDVGEETRNNLCFVVYNSLLRAVGAELAWQKLLLFNAGFKQPMTEKELQRTIVSCQRVGGYKYRNASIIRLLEITPEEQIQIGLYEPDSMYQPLTAYSGHPGRNAERALRREVRERQIQDLSTAGKSAAEIARELGIGRHQAEEKIKAVCGGSSIEQRRKRILSLLESGKTPTEIAGLEGCCLATVRNIRRKSQLSEAGKKETL